MTHSDRTEAPTPRYNVGTSGSFLATRASGRRIREEVEALLAQTSVVLDFSRVQAITVGFADELVGKLFSARVDGQFADRGIGIETANDDVWETIQTALARRGIEVRA